MPQQLLSDALEQAERSEPVVRAAALLHIARVLNAFDHAEAERVLDRGIALAGELAEPDREVILCEAVSLADLERIPNRALRLFAQIELAAALAGLPQMGGRSITPGPSGFRRSMAMRSRFQEDDSAPVPPFAAIGLQPPVRKPDVPPSTNVRISPTRRTHEEGPSGGSGPDYWVIEGAPLKPVLARLYDVPETRIDVPASLENERYDFVLVLPRTETQETMTRLMREGIEKRFHITEERRSMEVDVLTAPNGIRAHESHGDDSLFGFGSMDFIEKAQDGPRRIPDFFGLANIMDLHMVASEEPSNPEQALRRMKSEIFRAMCSSTPPGVSINSIVDSLTMEGLCRVLEGGLDRPIVDETHLNGTYALNVHAEAVTTRQFLRVLCDKLDLVVTPGRREIPMLVARQE
jgi:uncharacterized protein (TIGR03435 family)